MTNSRIYRFEVNKIVYPPHNGNVVASYKWTPTEETIDMVYRKPIFNKVRNVLTLAEFKSMVTMCKEGNNVIFDIDENMAFEVRHWSYHVKGV